MANTAKTTCEVWAIRHALGHLLPPALDDDGTDSYLAWPTQIQAERGLSFQLAQGYIEPGEGTVERIA